MTRSIEYTARAAAAVSRAREAWQAHPSRGGQATVDEVRVAVLPSGVWTVVGRDRCLRYAGSATDATEQAAALLEEQAAGDALVGELCPTWARQIAAVLAGAA